MALNRIQKLLFSEYCDFEEMVLVESPFAQTTREGHGLRQIHMGLTPSKLVLAVDMLPPAEESLVYFTKIDPEIETFELIAIYPIECVNLSVFRRRKRQTIKAHFSNHRILYFELGGFECRKMFWNLWCERVKFLSPEETRSSKSETSVATSSSNSTLNIVSSQLKIRNNNKQLWLKFGSGEMSKNIERDRWSEKQLYLDYSDSKIVQDIFLKKNSKMTVSVSSEEPGEKVELVKTESKMLHVNRFASGVTEGCGTGLYLPSESVIVPRNLRNTSEGSTDDLIYAQGSLSSTSQMDIKNITKNHVSRMRCRHPRKYGIRPLSHFLFGLGPWQLYKGERYNTQMKRCTSEVRIRKHLTEYEVRSPEKKVITTAIPSEFFQQNHGIDLESCVSKFAIPDENTVLFWTPDYWTKIESSASSSEFKRYIHKIRKKIHKEPDQKRKKNFIKRHSEVIKNILPEVNYATSVHSFEQILRNAFKQETASNAWDFDWNIFADQLTLIDKELFLKIEPYELYMISKQGTMKNAPNISAWISFSYRVSCLICTELLREQDSEALRARLIVRFINVAERCDKMGNFQSCRSILSGLQSIPIYRLHRTWTYVRQHHSLKYHSFGDLCKSYANPTLLMYQKYFYQATKKPPCLPYIGHVLGKLLGVTPKSAEDFIFFFDNRLDKVEELIHKAAKKKNKKQHKANIDPEPEIPIQETFSQRFIKFLTVFKRQSKPTVKKDEKPERKWRSKANKHKEKLDFIQFHKVPDHYNNENLTEAIRFLEECQKAATKYCFDKNDTAIEYFLKARYKDDKENYFNSFLIEKGLYYS